MVSMLGYFVFTLSIMVTVCEMRFIYLAVEVVFTESLAEVSCSDVFGSEGKVV